MPARVSSKTSEVSRSDPFTKTAKTARPRLPRFPQRLVSARLAQVAKVMDSSSYCCYGPFCGGCRAQCRVVCDQCAAAPTVGTPELSELPEEEVVTALKSAADAGGFATLGAAVIAFELLMPSAPHPDLMRLFSILASPKQIVVFYVGGQISDSICRFTQGWVDLLSPHEGVWALLHSDKCCCYLIAGGALGSVSLVVH